MYGTCFVKIGKQAGMHALILTLVKIFYIFSTVHFNNNAFDKGKTMNLYVKLHMFLCVVSYAVYASELSPLHHALLQLDISAAERLEKVQDLIDSRADVNEKCNYGQELTPLHVAGITQGYGSIISVLLNAGASPFIENKCGHHALTYTVAKGLIENFEIILKHIYDQKVNINHVDNNNQTVLYQIIQNEELSNDKKIAMIDICKKYGINFNHRDNQGATVLHYIATMKEKPDIIIALRSAGANATIVDNVGKKPNHYVDIQNVQNAIALNVSLGTINDN